MKTRKRFFVYIIYDPRPGKRNAPRYVGKGCGKRDKIHFNLGAEHYNKEFGKFFAECQQLDLVPKRSIVRTFASEETAFAYERRLITRYGRLDRGTGSLFNKTDGGEGWAGIWTDAAKKERGKVVKRWWTNPTYRRSQLAALRIASALVNSDPKFRKAQSERMRLEHANDAQSSRRIAWEQTVTSSAFHDAQSKRLTQTLKQLRANDKYSKREAARLRRIARERSESGASSQATRDQWANPKIAIPRRRQLIERNRSSKSRRNVSTKARQRWADANYRAKMIAAFKKSHALRQHQRP
jgi:hypothetical protein